MTTDSFLVLDDEPKTLSKTVRVYNPAGFDPKDYLPEALYKHADSVRHLVHVLHHNRFMYRRRPDEFVELFRSLFPNVYGVVTEIKRKDYRHLAHVLQRVESSLIVNRVARRCMDELPETFVATIHDSILTTPDAAGAVRAIMMHEFAQVGLVPTIRVEGLSTPSGTVTRTHLRSLAAPSGSG